MPPNGVGRLNAGFHGLLFVVFPALFEPASVGGGVARRAQQPSRQSGFAGNRPGFCREGQENGLGHVLRRVGVAHLPRGGRIDQIDVTFRQQTESVLRLSQRIRLKQFKIVHNTGLQ